ncbi:CLUMA_CG016456, isoform A [Clunio marinus]|uniref:CLUMA_CG016456, isoform A n=1 Tax=Clunio marinus TaxID=568069 RepID=A0A1J1IS19_9DIPT|nr:CLUMA_CG016456, isoform A [Clunio marinus]
MDSESVIKNINLAISYINLDDVDLDFDSVRDETFKKELRNLFQKLKDEPNIDSRTETFDEIIQMVRGQLKSLETVGQILDFLGFTIKMLFVEKSTTTTDLSLLNELFQLMPAQWETDPVKVHLITKIIYETLNADFNNTMHVITSIICINNKLGFYVALTLFWALYLNYFKKDSHHYYKMYNVDKFFKLLMTCDFTSGKQDADSLFKLLLLTSIYQNNVLLNKDNPEDHQIFQEFFKVTQKDCEKLKDWLINVKSLIEANNSLVKSNQSSDVLMLLEFLELDIIRGISQDGNQQSVMDPLTDISHATVSKDE